MVLEATMLVLDNSEYMRNGDYTPTRWDAQVDAVNIVFDAKTNSHPENMVGCLTMAGKSPEVLATLTQDMGKLLAALHSSKLIGSSDLATGINVASLALKHRQNKTQRQRIILFVGSPISDTSESLARIARKLKKNNVAVDVVSFGEVEGNEEALRALIENVDNGGNSHLLTLPPSPQLLSDLILSSPILMEEGAGPSGEGGEGGASGGAGGGGFDFGVDPSMDPELAMALRMSLEEEQARQRAAEASSSQPHASTLPSVPEASATDAGAASAPPASTTAPGSGTGSGSVDAFSSAPQPPAALPSLGSLVQPGADGLSGVGSEAVDDSEEAMMRQALALSRGNDGEEATPQSQQPEARATVAGASEGDEDVEMSEEEAIARAIEMSLKEDEENAK